MSVPAEARAAVASVPGERPRAEPPAQLELFNVETTNGNGTKPTVAELGLGNQSIPGPARLLRELAKRGLDESDLPAAAALALALDELLAEDR